MKGSWGGGAGSSMNTRILSKEILRWTIATGMAGVVAGALEGAVIWNPRILEEILMPPWRMVIAAVSIAGLGTAALQSWLLLGTARVRVSWVASTLVGWHVGYVAALILFERPGLSIHTTLVGSPAILGMAVAVCIQRIVAPRTFVKGWVPLFLASLLGGLAGGAAAIPASLIMERLTPPTLPPTLDKAIQCTWAAGVHYVILGAFAGAAVACFCEFPESVKRADGDQVGHRRPPRLER